MVVLYKLRFTTGALELSLVPALKEATSLVRKNGGLDNQNVGNTGRSHFHAVDLHSLFEDLKKVSAVAGFGQRTHELEELVAIDQSCPISDLFMTRKPLASLTFLSILHCPIPTNQHCADAGAFHLGSVCVALVNSQYLLNVPNTRNHTPLEKHRLVAGAPHDLVRM